MSFIIQVHINKTGGTSLREAVPGLIFQEPRHQTAQELRKQYGSGFDSALSFAFVRNPYSRVVSQYEYRRKKHREGVNEPGLVPGGVSFSEWVKAVYEERDARNGFFHDQRFFMPCTWWVNDDEGYRLIDKVYRFESFDTEVERLRDAMKARQLPGWSFVVPHLKKNTYRAHWREYYDDETRDIVARFFEPDLEEFKYGFE